MKLYAAETVGDYSLSRVKVIDAVSLTIMGNIDGSARSENSGNARIVKASGVCGAELSLEGGTGSMSAHACQ